MIDTMDSIGKNTVRVSREEREGALGYSVTLAGGKFSCVSCQNGELGGQ
jgi:hypothetical protein